MKKSMMICSIKAHVLESGILGKSFTGSIKLMVSEGSSAMRYAAEIADVKRKQFEIFQAASNEKNYVYKEVLLQKFDDNILLLWTIF